MWTGRGRLFLAMITVVVVLLAMTAFHMHLAAARRGFEADGRRRTGRYWRVMNEAPTLLLALIVVMVIVKPGLGR